MSTAQTQTTSSSELATLPTHRASSSNNSQEELADQRPTSGPSGTSSNEPCQSNTNNHRRQSSVTTRPRGRSIVSRQESIIASNVVINESLHVSKLAILIDRLDYEFRPGDCVSGKLHLVLDSGLLLVRRLRITLRGIASVRFTEREYQSASQNERHFENVNYWADHQILEYMYNPKLPDIKVLWPGEYFLPFKFTLPKTCIPSSFESYYGHIRYWLSGEVRPRSKPQTQDEEYEKISEDFEVVVVSPPNLPIADLLKPITAERVKEVGCCSCFTRNPGFIQVRANLAHQAQRRGGCVQVNLFIVNRSSKHVTPSATLKEKQEFKALAKSKIYEQELIGCFGITVKPGESLFQSIILPLSVDLPVMHNCPIILIGYKIKIGIEIPRAFDMFFHIPLILTDDALPVPQGPLSLTES